MFSYVEVKTFDLKVEENRIVITRDLRKVGRRGDRGRLEMSTKTEE